MTATQGIQAHPLFKLGKAAAVCDMGTVAFVQLLRAAKALPTKYDFDTTHPGNRFKKTIISQAQLDALLPAA